MSDRTQPNTTPKKHAPRWEKAFLTSLRDLGNVRLACEAAKIERSTAYDRRNTHPAFAAAWDAALDQAADLLEEEARRRAYEGWDEPVFGSLGFRMGSGAVGYVRKYSDTLLIFLLKGIRPEKYRETTRNININLTPDEAAKLSDAEIEAKLKQAGLL